MCKKYVCLIFLVLMLTIAGNALAVDINWTNGNGNRLWTTAANWSGSVIPTTADKAAIRNSAVSGPIINTGMAAVAAQVVVGDWSSTSDTLDITGGSLTTGSWFTVGYSTANNGTLTMSGGTINAGSSLYIGRAGTGTLNMTGGTINVTTGFAIAQVAGGVGDVFLDGGTISCGSFAMTSGGAMDITTGTLIVNGDVTSTINGYITGGQITGYGGAGTVNVSYNTPNAGKTTVTATGGGSPPSAATNPSPANSATGVATNATLSWSAGSGATSHDVYFGTDSTPDSTEFIGNQSGTTYNPGTLANSTTYYWRIDEVNASGTTTGTVWSFTTVAGSGLSDTTDDGLGTITANGENLPNEGMAKAFDNTTATKWLDFSPSGSWIQYQYASSKISTVTEYTLTSANDAQERDPTNWNLLGSNNGGASWVTLDTRSGELFTARFQTRSFSFSNSTGYNIYRLSITALRGPTPNSVQLAEIELIGTPPEPPAPEPPSAATNPNPSNGATNVSTSATLSWTAGSGATTHDVYFGVDSTPDSTEFIGNQSGTTYNPGSLAYSTTYYWRIDEKNAVGTTTGTVWSFTTASAPQPPSAATNPTPANGATGIAIATDISWSAGSGATSHDVYFGTTSPGTFQGNQAGTTFDTGTMAYNTTYYWRIDEKNAAGTTTGTVWSFTTAAVAGVDRNWTNGNGNRAWGTAANWSGSVVPTGADKAAVRNTAVSGPIIASGTNAVANTVVVGDWSSTNDTINMTGGSLTVNDWFVLAYGPTSNHGTFTMTGGTVSVGGAMYVGNTGTSVGVLDISGGTINVTGVLGIAQVTGSTGDVFLDGGTISCGSLNMTSGGAMDITAGTLIVNGDATSTINGYISSSLITAYGGAGTVNVSYNTPNAGKTTVTGTPSSNPPSKATGPSPANAATGVGITTDLGWTAGAGATSHDVYFGTASPGTFRGNQAGTTYDTGTMAYSTTYYWRIDEKNAYGTTAGDVWHFTTGASVPANRRKGPYLIFPGNNTQMTVLWQIDVTTTCNIAWGTSTSYSTGNANTSEYGSDHQHKYNITGLTPGTRYYYRVTIGSNNYTGSFNAAPASSATAIKFFMYGDTRSNGSSNNTVCGQMVSTYNADAAYRSLVLHAGDWVSSDGESQWTSEWYNYSWTNIVNATANAAFMGCIGNHEGGASVYKKYRPFPFVSATYFSFDYGPLHVAVVDQYTSYTSGSAQYNWLNTDLTNSTKLWKIIVLHQPGWSCNGGHSNDTTVQNTIQPLCVSKGVSIVLAGHNHYYSRAVVSGVHHITAGNGGAPLYTPASGQPYIVTYNKSIGVSKVVISGNSLTCTTVNGSGSVIDTFTVNK